MNAKQKAEAWLALYDSEKGHTAFKADAANIVTVLLAEREALLEALRPVGWHGVISATIINNAMKAITLCEKEHDS